MGLAQTSCEIGMAPLAEESSMSSHRPEVATNAADLSRIRDNRSLRGAMKQTLGWTSTLTPVKPQGRAEKRKSLVTSS